MEGKFQTSFIPKKTATVATPTRTHTSVNLFMVTGIIILLLSSLAALSLFLYGRLLQSQIGAMNQQLEDAQKAIRPDDILAWKRLDYRIRSVKEIVKNHVATTILFSILQDETLQRVQFKEFSYKTDSGGVVKLSLSGQADAYTTVALQADEFSKNKYFMSPLFEGLNLDDRGRVEFRFSTIIDWRTLAYGDLINGQKSPSSGVATGTPMGTMPNLDELPR